MSLPLTRPRAAYASHPDRSRGRLYPTDPSPTRTEFQRDRDRIIHSTAFRRLQYKTQVFLAHEGGHFRTRLTHTLEVSQIARSIARALALDEDLTEALALAHDLGHPPFGHAGERILDARMAEAGGFDHNMQAIRVVTLIENHYAGHDGLNLTWEMLEGILKHNGPLTDAGGAPAGRYAEGLPFGALDVLASTDLMLSQFAGPEAQAAAVADDIAYDGHDIDDAVRAGLLTLDDLAEAPLVGGIVADVRERYRDVSPSRQAHELVRRVITLMVEQAIAHGQAALAELKPNSADDLRSAGRALIDFPPALAAEERRLKQFMFERVYRHPEVMRHVHAGQGVVERLFDAYAKGAAMPGRWGQQARGQSGASLDRTICDFLAGMTDPFALSEYQRLFDERIDFV